MSQFSRVKDFENHALQILPTYVKCYYNCGEGEEDTIKWNRESFKRYRIIPRVLKNVSNLDISTIVLGEKVSMPLGVSPTGFQKFAHNDGECGIAKAAEAAKTIYILSCFSTYSIDEVAAAAPNAIKWMMFSIYKDREATLHIVRKAEKAGFKALVVIVDNPTYGKSKSDNLRASLMECQAKICVYEEYLAEKGVLSKNTVDSMLQYSNDLVDNSLTWKDIAWLKSQTKLPIVLKGILSVEDALLGVEHGASAIYVSNHGGRQLDGVLATIEALPAIAKAVANKAEVYVDGGVTKGSDVFKALALGARMVFVGRSMLWGLACGGEQGAWAVLEIYRREIEHTFAITGCSSVKQVTKNLVAHESCFYH